MTPATIGLIVFVLVVAADAVTLLYDLYLRLSGRTMITAYVRRHREWVIPLVGWQLLGAAGLLVHFLTTGN